MGQILTLGENMVNMIAAGEVIERPASVVKELMENSIDAGATKIIVSIEDGGRKLISVADNGFGMDADDLPAAFEPHATSKIKTCSDLRHISTLGFRGEALASIASVAEVRAVSKARNEHSGYRIEIDCGKKNPVKPCGGDFGTTIQVRNLFYKLPARRKFLRTANTEMGHISEQFTRIALANSSLDMTLIHNGRELYSLPEKTGVRRRIGQLLSSEISENLIEAESNEKTLRIRALMGNSSLSKTAGRFQYVFLNGRFIRDRFISHAVKEAYRGIIEPDRFPVIFLFIEMPYEQYDVNVHPTKVEVRFYNANLVHSQILGVLREKLLGTNLETQGKLPARTYAEKSDRRETITNAMAEFFKKHRPIQTQQQSGYRPTAIHTNTGQTKTTESLGRHYPAAAIQIHDSFIIAQNDDGFIIIDQHALHERIIYEDLRRRISKSKLQSQRLLIPESFELSDIQSSALERHAGVFETLGMEVVPFGPRTWAVQAFPTLLAAAAPADLVIDLLDLLSDSSNRTLDTERLFDEVLNMTACRAAIKAGQKLTEAEIEQLLADRDRLEHSQRCPHGRPTTIKFSLMELEKQFKRT